MRLLPRLRRPSLALCLLPVLSVLLPLSAANAQLTAKMREAVVRDVAGRLAEGYVFEEVGHEYANALEIALGDGAFDSFEDAGALAAEITARLREVQHDRHLNVWPPTRRTRPAFGPRPADRESDEFNDGFKRAEVLDGNVGYLDLRSFSDSPRAVAKVDAVMSLFDRVDAMIIDVGLNGGGTNLVIRRLCAYFFAERHLLHMTDSRRWEAPRENWTDAVVPGRVRPTLPIFVVTSPNTGSAAEAFSFSMKISERATLIGETTGGAGHFGEIVTLAHDFTMFVPQGRAYHPETGKGWEGVGVEPDITMPYLEAQREAQALARAAAEEQRHLRKEILELVEAEIEAAGQVLADGDAAGAEEMLAGALAGALEADVIDPLGWIQLATRRGPEAVQGLSRLMLEAVHEQAPTCEVALYELAREASQRDDEEVALDYVTRALELVPHYRAARELLTRLREE